MTETIKIAPQKGPQTEFLACGADICGYGGAAGGGKTYALLLQCLRHIHDPSFIAMIFRRESEHILLPGGLWDTSMEIYPLLDARPRTREKQWIFPSGAKVQFSAMQYEQNKLKFQGSQASLVMFDELTHFSESQVEYVFSRLRNAKGGVKPYVRMTMNPDPNSWVKRFFAPWVDSSYYIQADFGEILWRRRREGSNDVEWFREPVEDATSMTFIKSTIYDNQILMNNDPGYLKMLKGLPLVEQKALLEGSWDIVQDGDWFRESWIEKLDEAPECVTTVRYWDLAMSETQNRKNKDEDLDYAVGTLMGKTADNKIVVLDVQRTRGTPNQVEALMRRTAAMDGTTVPIYVEREGGSMAVGYMQKIKNEVLQDFHVIEVVVQGMSKKQVRIKPLSSCAESGRLMIVRGNWNRAWLNEMCAYPNVVHDDQADSAAGAFGVLAKASIEPMMKIINVKGSGATVTLPEGKELELPNPLDAVFRLMTDR